MLLYLLLYGLALTLLLDHPLLVVADLVGDVPHGGLELNLLLHTHGLPAAEQLRLHAEGEALLHSGSTGLLLRGGLLGLDGAGVGRLGLLVQVGLNLGQV